MNVLVTGATGFVGTALCLRLQREGHQVVAWVRDLGAARSKLGAGVRLIAGTVSDERLAAVVGGCDGVVNLAGAPVAKRWTKAHRRAMRDSRVGVTERLVQAIRVAKAKGEGPRAMVSASAIGVYGERGDEELDANSEPGEGFLAELSRTWELTALGAEASGVRVSLLRIGLVLGREGGALATMRPAFSAGLGGVLGNGRQWMSWIHLDDLLELSYRALVDESMRGVYEAVAPEPVRNRSFTRSYAGALGRRPGPPVPAPALRLVFGGAARVILGSQRVRPTRTSASGFRFRFAALNEALDDLCQSSTVRISDVEHSPSSPYLRRRPVRHRLHQVAFVDRPLQEVFPFFERPENLGALTPASLSFNITTPSPVPMHEGASIDYRIGLSGLPMRWRTEIEQYEPGEGFVDVQMRGPYRAWHHQHRFESTPEGGTRVTDIVHYSVPLGFLGRFIHRWFVAPQLRRIFEFRADAIRWRFGTVASRGWDSAA